VALVGAATLPLTAGQAQASVIYCDFQPTPGACGGPVTLGDKIIQAIAPPTSGTGIVDFEELNPLKYVSDIDFDPTATASGSFDYVINITDPLFAFHEVILNWNPLGSFPEVKKEIFKANTFNPADLLGTISTNNGEFKLSDLPDQYTHLWIRDTWTLDPGENVDNITNTFTQTNISNKVPGPLPLLGAGAAFGFSRRLRRRTKQNYSLG
jgi:hypothetical protein